MLERIRGSRDPANVANLIWVTKGSGFLVKGNVSIASGSRKRIRKTQNLMLSDVGREYIVKELGVGPLES